ncbi:hypothetical protein BCF44_110231 [Kutzneria buriramensis]|uniref:Uncharacterized protein n=1 Tax=Kutzneria buriramensis TaxID=1045776 RepID=A0A3E0HD56_9PSEU|nr:hypothetical protein BCF44_110231 [Kutzneria buriramensis]
MTANGHALQHDSVLSAQELEEARAAGRAVRFTPAQKDRLRDIFRPSVLKLARQHPTV